MRNPSTLSETFVDSALTLVFWLCASLLIMQPVNLYFTDEITQFFNFDSIVDRETLFVSFIVAYSITMVVSLFISRVIRHTYILCIGLSIVLIAVMLFFAVPSFVTAAIVGGGLGFIPASAVCAVVEKLGVSSDDGQQNSLDIAQARGVRPVGMYIFIPVIATLAIIAKSIFGILFVVIVSCISIVFLLLRKKNFGFFVSKPTFKKSISGTFGNYTFYLVLSMLVFISLIDVSVFYYVPHVVQDYVLYDSKNMTALVLLVMLMWRIAMIVFAELALIHVPPRRILILSSCAIGFAVLILSLARDEKAKIILLFVIAASLSVAFPSLIKSMAKFTPFSVLPAAVIGMAFVGSIVTIVSYTYVFPYVLQMNRIIFFDGLFAVSFIFLVVLFFIISRRKKLVLDDGT